MRRFISKKRALTFGAASALIVVAIAVAYFTTTGEGEGDAEVGTSTAVAITAEVTGALYPGTSSDVKFKVDNPSKGHQFVDTVSLTGVEAFKDAGHTEPKPGCESSWFDMTPVEAEQDIAGETEATLTEEGSLEFLNKNESQDACKNAYLVASFSSN
jgi:uncharacterized membrane protein